MSNTPDEVLKKIEQAKRNNSTKLYISWCGLTQFPFEILKLTNLTELNLPINTKFGCNQKYQYVIFYKKSILDH